MKKIRAAVVGYGNIGKYAIQALEAAEDFEIAGIVRRNGAADRPAELASYEVVKDITELKDVDVAILATPTRSCEEYAKKILPLGINTVDPSTRYARRAALSRLSPPAGIRAATASCAPSCRASPPKVCRTPTSAPACRWATPSACAPRPA